jgi:hypothetical protein
MKKSTFLAGIIFIFAFILTGSFVQHYLEGRNLEGPTAPESTPFEEIIQPNPQNNLQPENLGPGPNSNLSPSPFPSTSPYPLSLNIEMPFYTQAPHANWDYPWQEACEEASVLLTANLYNSLNLGLEPYNTELLRLVDWEVDYFGSYEHTTVAQTAEMLQIQYSLDSRIHENPTFEDIQAILSEGHLIIAPFAGKHLGNPNFRNGGPNYHMLVIKGYDASKSQIVTHDVGTRNGENYVYDWSIIEYALHDWHDNDMLLGDKKIIEVLP